MGNHLTLKQMGFLSLGCGPGSEGSVGNVGLGPGIVSLSEKPHRHVLHEESHLLPGSDFW